MQSPPKMPSTKEPRAEHQNLLAYVERVEKGQTVNMRALIKVESLRNNPDGDWIAGDVVIKDTELLSGEENPLDVRLKAGAYLLGGLCEQVLADMLTGKRQIDRQTGITPSEIAQVLTSLKAFNVTPENRRKQSVSKTANVIPIKRERG